MTEGGRRSARRFIGPAVAVASLLVLFVMGEGVARLTWILHAPLEPAGTPEEWKDLPVLDGLVAASRPNQLGIYNGVLFETNKAGFRGPDRMVKKHPVLFRAVLMGDSVTMGSGVINEENYASLLQHSFDASAMLPKRKFQVLNIGLAGLNTVWAVARLKKLGLKYDPDLIVYGYTLNDIEGKAYRSTMVPRYTNPFLFANSNLYLVRYLAPRFYSMLATIARPVGSYSYELDDNYFRNPEAWGRVEASLDELASIAEKRKICVVMLIHTRLVSLGVLHPFTEHYAVAAEAGRKRGFYVSESFRYHKGLKGDDLWLRPWDQHPNAQGHRILYQALTDGLRGLPPSCWQRRA